MVSHVMQYAVTLVTVMPGENRNNDHLGIAHASRHTKCTMNLLQSAFLVCGVFFCSLLLFAAVCIENGVAGHIDVTES